jgi:hypothetical protein
VKWSEVKWIRSTEEIQYFQKQELEIDKWSKMNLSAVKVIESRWSEMNSKYRGNEYFQEQELEIDKWSEMK